VGVAAVAVTVAPPSPGAGAEPPGLAGAAQALGAPTPGASEATSSQQRARPWTGEHPGTPQRDREVSPSVKEADETPTKVNSPWQSRRSSSGFGAGNYGGAVPTPQGRLGASAWGNSGRPRSLARRSKPGSRAPHETSLTGSPAKYHSAGPVPRDGAQPQEPCTPGRLQVRGEQLAPAQATAAASKATALCAGEAQEWERPPLEDFSIGTPHLGAEAARRSPEELPFPLRQQLQFIRILPELPCSELSDGTRPFLPPLPPEASSKPTLVLDLDETLVHCWRGPRTNSPPAPPDLIVHFDEMSASVGSVLFRPFVSFFLDAAAQSFEIVVFTASQQVYADKVIDALDPTGVHIAHRLYRQHCTELRGAFFKELSLLGRPVRRCILVDNSPISVACNPDQGVLIRSWYGDQEDQELVELLSMLQELQGCEKGPGAYLDGRYGLQDFFRTLRAGANSSPTPASQPGVAAAPFQARCPLGRALPERVGLRQHGLRRAGRDA